MKIIEIYFEDLKPNIQKKYRKYFDAEINVNMPILTIEKENDGDKDINNPNF